MPAFIPGRHRLRKSDFKRTHYRRPGVEGTVRSTPGLSKPLPRSPCRGLRPRASMRPAAKYPAICHSIARVASAASFGDTSRFLKRKDRPNQTTGPAARGKYVGSSGKIPSKCFAAVDQPGRRVESKWQYDRGSNEPAFFAPARDPFSTPGHRARASRFDGVSCACSLITTPAAAGIRAIGSAWV